MLWVGSVGQGDGLASHLLVGLGVVQAHCELVEIPGGLVQLGSLLDLLEYLVYVHGEPLPQIG